ncbi:tetraacyldisaccharide 4'-kinase [Candidatus Fermentibacteria bacterium]|nr:tetraacyldisaccharide 4'-kinase [Candidatus Fermentibacteria bacterium]
MRRRVGTWIQEVWYDRRRAPAPVALMLRAGEQVWKAGLWVHGRMGTSRESSDLPTIGITSPTAGGSGKTPVARWLATEMTAAGWDAAVITRGHGGRLPGPVRVDTGMHSARDVGDEPLWLASHLGDIPVIVSRDRQAGIAAAQEQGAVVAVLDDVTMNRSIVLDAVVMVLGASGWIGNGKCLPAGPLRMPLPMIATPDIVVVVQESSTPPDGRHRASLLSQGAPVVSATAFPATVVAPDGNTSTPAKIRGMHVLSWAGIARPWRFREVLLDMGVDIRGFVSFPDHHVYSRRDIDTLAKAADRLDALPLTTAKDMARWPLDARWRPHFLEMGLSIDEPDAVLQILIRRLETRA